MREVVIPPKSGASDWDSIANKPTDLVVESDLNVLRPVIATHPTDQTASAGATATFTVSATTVQHATLSYQWQKQESGAGAWSNISGATSASLAVVTTEADNTDKYRCVVSNVFGSETSNAATLTVTDAQYLTEMPSGTNPIRLVIEGNSMSVNLTTGINSLLVAEYGSGRFNLTNVATSGQTTAQMLADYETQVGSIAVDNATFATIWTLVNDFYLSSITARAAVDQLWQWCDAAVADGIRPIVITPTPRNNEGTPVDYESRRQSAIALIRAEWQDHCSGVLDLAADPRLGDAADINNTTYYADGVHMTEAGYTIVQTGIKRCIDALLAGNPTGVPLFDTQPTNQSVLVDATATFTGYAVGEGINGISYQWEVSTNSGASWANVSGATSPTYTTGALLIGDNGKQYRLKATSTRGSAYSNTVTLTVTAPPTTPDTFSGLLGYWNAATSVFQEHNATTTPSSNSNPVGTWVSSGTSAKFTAAASGSTRPTLITNALNSKPVVRFDGTDDAMTADAALNAKTIFMVVKYNGTTWLQNYPGIITSNANGSTGLSMEGTEAGLTRLQDNLLGSGTVFRSNGSQTTINITFPDDVDGPMNAWKVIIIRNASAFNYTWRMGSGRATGSRFADMDVAALAIYSDQLSDANCTSLENWAKSEYGLTF